ncbi:collagenase-like [Lucilia sericata]|uniref:collagenase-like n=1 Tax=Lucilia sericata TaxID=13632 RepID=UPI0018A85E32|nr:collagenase-like [Lucilia sericata]
MDPLFSEILIQKRFSNMKTFLAKLSILWIVCTLNVQIQAEPSSQNEAIVSGWQAAEGQFPWHVILRRDAGDQLLCGASLISDKWVLTCAHCLEEEDSVLVVFGSIQLSNSDVNMTSTKLYIYPHYDEENLINDMGLVELPTPVTFSNNIQAITLVTAEEEALKNHFIGAKAIISGFGWISDMANMNNEWLLWTSVDVIDNSICAHVYNEEIEDSIICAQGPNGTYQSPCDGDSGGALVWKNEANNFVQIGIYSFSKKNNCSRFPSGYTRVSSYLDYIHNITGLNL